MKKILLLMSALMLAALTSSCEGTGENGSGNGPEKIGGTFVAEGISASYKYATNFYEVNDENGIIGHAVYFSNIPFDWDEGYTLKEGERLELFGFLLASELDKTELESHEFNDLKTGDFDVSHLPQIISLGVSCWEGTSNPDEMKTIYSLEFSDKSSGNLKITRDGDNYKITGEFIMECFSDSDGTDDTIMKKSTFSYYGPIKTVPADVFQEHQ